MMWEETPESMPKPRESRFFLDWMDREVLRDDVTSQAEVVLTEAEQEVGAPVRRYRTTPQSAPWHVEGPTVAHHVRRAIAGVLAITEGADVLEIEEIAREKTLLGEFSELQRTIRANAGTMLAFALVHDMGKPDTLTFDAPRGTGGEREGFSTNKRTRSKSASEDERQHYLKLVRAFAEKEEIEDHAELTAAFYDEYEIKTHFYGHERVGSSEKYRDAREAIGGLYHMSADDLAMLQLIIKNHIDAIMSFKDAPDPAKFRSFVERANRAGFDADDFLDLLLAGMFIDVTVGSLMYRDGQYSAQFEPVINFLKSEYEVLPRRREERREEVDLKDRKRVKLALQAANLLGGDVFSLLNIPFGPKRGDIMRKIREAVEDPAAPVDFGPHTEEMYRRIETARSLLTQKVRP